MRVKPVIYYRCPVCLRKRVNLRRTKVTDPRYKCSNCGWHVPKKPTNPIDKKRIADLKRENSGADV